MAKSRRYIAQAIKECLEEHGDWIKVRDLQPLVCDRLGEYVSKEKVRGHLTTYEIGCRRFDETAFEYKL